MRCRKTKRLLPLFLDGQLSQRLTLKVKSHLETCSVCAKECDLLRQTWDLLDEWKPVFPSPNFKAIFWQRVFQEEKVLQRKPVFVFPRLRPSFVPAFATLAIILVIGVILTNFLSAPSIQNLALLTGDQDIRMLERLDLVQDFEIIKNLNLLEDFEIINSIES